MNTWVLRGPTDRPIRLISEKLNFWNRYQNKGEIKIYMSVVGKWTGFSVFTNAWYYRVYNHL
jgi:hypothetical protein